MQFFLFSCFKHLGDLRSSWLNKGKLARIIMHQSFVTTDPLPMGKGWGIAGLKCRAITFRVSSQCSGNDGVLILNPGIFSIAKGGAKSKVLTSSLPPGGGVHSRARKAEKP